jgi:glutamine synthetase
MGVLNGEELVWGDCEIDPANLTDNDRFELSIEEMLPASLPDALTALRADTGLCERMGEELVERYVGVKHAEMRLLDKMGEEELRKWVLERY